MPRTNALAYLLGIKVLKEKKFYNIDARREITKKVRSFKTLLNFIFIIYNATTNAYAHTHTHTHTHAHTYTDTPIHAYTHTYMHTCTHTQHMHTWTHEHMHT